MFALMDLYEANLSDITSKYETDIFSSIHVDCALISVNSGYHIDKFDTEIEISNFEEYRARQEKRLKKYVALY